MNQFIFLFAAKDQAPSCWAGVARRNEAGKTFNGPASFSYAFGRGRGSGPRPPGCPRSGPRSPFFWSRSCLLRTGFGSRIVV
jgi:hypothetical protein